MNTTYRKNLKDVAIACKNYVDTVFNNFRWELGSHTLDVESDTDTSFSKSVPSDTIGCQINQVGGMSYKSENLLNIADVAQTVKNGITYSVVNGVLSVSGIASADTIIEINLSLNVNAETYYLKVFNWATGLGIDYWCINSSYTYDFYNTSNGSSSSNTKTYSTSNLLRTMQFKIANGTAISSTLQFKPMLVSGSTAPTTWSEGFSGIRNTAVTSVVSKDSNDTTLDTLTIHTAIQNLIGWGWGINDTCYNYIDFDRKVFVQKVGRAKISDLSWTFDTSTYRANVVANDMKVATTRTLKLLLSGYDSIYNGETYEASWDKVIYSTYPNTIYVTNKSYSSLEQFLANEGDKYIYYPLKTPIETDISAYLTTDTIDVEPLGTLEFTNAYNQDVPSDIDYLIEEVKA